MKVNHLVLLLPLLLVLAGGCATHALWQNERLEVFKEPADKPHLRLFESKPQTNLLVIYDEASDSNDSIRTRAYWLNENQTRLEQSLRPHFTRASARRNLPAVPVFYEPMAAGTNLPPGLCAVVAANNHSFTLYLAHHPIGTHLLPVYNNGQGLAAKIALTPVAVTADLTIVGGVLAYIFTGGGENSPPASAGGGPYD